MTMGEHPVIACYHGADSSEAVQVGALVAARTRQPLVIASAFRYEPAARSARVGDEENSRRFDAAGARVQRAMRLVPDGVEVRDRVLPAEGIAVALIDLAHELDASALVTGRDLHGHVTRSVIEHARCPVIVTPFGLPLLAAEPIRTLGIAYDGSPGAHLALSAALHLAVAADTEVKVMRRGGHVSCACRRQGCRGDAARGDRGRRAPARRRSERMPGRGERAPRPAVLRFARSWTRALGGPRQRLLAPRPSSALLGRGHPAADPAPHGDPAGAHDRRGVAAHMGLIRSSPRSRRAERPDAGVGSAEQTRGMSDPTVTQALRVVVVGGGTAAVETVLALDALAGDRVRVTMIAPEPDFVLRAMTVTAPFHRGSVERLPLAMVMAEHAGDFIQAVVERVDRDAHEVVLDDGGTVAYDALILAPGAQKTARHEDALTFGIDVLGLNAILADLEEGSSRSVAFVVPAGCTWPLAIYELALMTADELWSMHLDEVEMHLVTPEVAPLALFGGETSAVVARLLADAHITLHCGTRPQIRRNGRVRTGDGPDLLADRVVTLPELRGPSIEGVPSNADGFVPVDDGGHVDGAPGVFAVGDATDRPIKHGGLACQQADVTAAHVAVLAGVDVGVPPLYQELRAQLLTGARDVFLQRGADAPGDTGAARWPTAKVSGKHLAPYLHAKDVVHLPERSGGREPGFHTPGELAGRRPIVVERGREERRLRAVTPGPPHPLPAPLPHRR